MATNRKHPLMADSVIEKDTKQSSDKVIQVFIRLMFLRIGDIDTLNERFYAKAYVEARWLVELNNFASDLSSENQKRLTEGKTVSLLKYAESHWHPQLSIENSFGDLKQQIRYSAKKTKKDNEVCICEHRDIKGIFWEKLELQDFPFDVQDLSISIASMFYDDKVMLVPDSRHLSGVNREAFTNQQEWSLYERVNTDQTFIKEFLFQAADEEDDDEDGKEDIGNDEDRKRSLLVVKCHAARRSRYFYWNAYFLILLITLLAFCSYALPPSDTSSRMQILCTLLLTSIAFRWTVTQSLPHISYLTSLDIYALLCIFILVTQTIWHAIIGALVYEAKADHDIKSNLEWIRLDQYVCWISIIVFILMHIAFIFWLFLYPFRERKLLKQNDIQYRLLLGEKRKHKSKPIYNRQSRHFPTYSRIPIE